MSSMILIMMSLVLVLPAAAIVFLIVRAALKNKKASEAEAQLEKTAIKDL